MLQVDKTTKQKAEKSPARVRPFVGYIRVSTQRQAEQGFSLDAQTDMLRGYVSKVRGGDLLAIYEDPESGYSNTRKGLLDAIKEALRTGASLVVPSADRLSRNVEVMKLLDVPGLRFYCVDRGRISKPDLRALIAKAQKVREDIASRSVTSAAKSKMSSGGRSGLSKISKSAQRLGSIANLARAQQKVADVADFIADNPAVEALGWKERVASLNDAGILNLKSAKRDEYIPWTYGALRRVWEAALTELAFRREMDAADIAEDFKGKSD